ncbi:hypothetical protein G3A39_39915 [Paraburkholderia aspalathi]|nr:hypothetical protein [Paraburkholderia aspalathi]
MPNIDDIYRYLYGAWRMMLGKKDGIDQLDISAEGFWQSFYAIAVALPPLLAGWVAYSADLTAGGEDATLRFTIVLRAAFVDIVAWIAPIVVLTFIVHRIGLAKRFAPYVIASNWGGALLAWAFAPVTLVQLLLPGRNDAITLLAVIVFGASIVFSYRLTQTALQRPHTYALPFFACIFFGSLFVTILLQQILGIGFEAMQKI